MKRLLDHPWYQKWETGCLPVESLRHYASEYYWQVSRFPRYLSGIHSRLESLEDRQVILRNLLDEENEREPHPELWLRFAEALGASPDELRGGKPGAAATALTRKFQALVDAGPASGLGALRAYESQVPEIAKFKKAALRQHYLSDGSPGLRFFEVHEQADVWHAAEVEGLIAKLSAEDRQVARVSSEKAAEALWEFLDAMPN